MASPKIGQPTVEVGGVTEDVRLAGTRMMRAINVLGIPSLAMPCGFSESLAAEGVAGRSKQGGLPLGMQILGAPRNEDMLLRIGAALEDAMGFAGRIASRI